MAVKKKVQPPSPKQLQIQVEDIDMREDTENSETRKINQEIKKNQQILEDGKKFDKNKANFLTWGMTPDEYMPN